MNLRKILTTHRYLVLHSVLITTLAGANWSKHTPSETIVSEDFLRPLVLPFRNWETEDLELTPQERQLLQPDAVLIRQYRTRNKQEKNQQAELAVIAGHRKQSVHTPAFCMSGGGWEILSQEPCELQIAGRTWPAMRTLMARERNRILVTFFFTDGQNATRSLPQYQYRQLWKRLRGESSLGALVRIIVPMQQRPEAAIQFTEEFAQTVAPPVLKQLQIATQPSDSLSVKAAIEPGIAAHSSR